MDLEQINILWKEMRAEVYAVQAWAREEPESDLRKRALVRSMASFIESCINSLSKAVVTETVGLPTAEYAVLSETQFELAGNGAVKERPRFYPAISRWRLLVRVLERRIGTSHWRVDFSDKGFVCLQELFEIRNRITHPRVSGSMKVEFEEIEACVNGFTWFVRNYQGLCKIEFSRNAQ